MSDAKYNPIPSAHWYDQDGIPCHEVPNASKPGEMRPTTLKDAKKLNLVPSVTTLLSLIAKPAVKNWLVNIAVDAALETGDAEKAVALIEERSTEAAKRGTEIHGALEHALWNMQAGLPYDNIEGAPPETIRAVTEWVKREVNTGYAVERSFATRFYGGCVDFETPKLVVDFKTSKNPRSWPEHCWQLAAYVHAGDPNRVCMNLLIDTENPGVIKAKLWEPEEIEHGWKIFNAVATTWQLIKKWGME